MKIKHIGRCYSVDWNSR